MDYPIREIQDEEWPPLLREIPDPPKKLTMRGALPPRENKLLAVVGSRKYTSYGKEAVERLIAPLSGYPITIVSGLALGIDGLAHEAALRAHLHTIAVPGSGIDDSVLYPRSNFLLGQRILGAGGVLLSEFEPTFTPTVWAFAQRNRIMAGMSHAILLIEAREKSGTLITARLASDYNREVLAVPGSIFSETSAGTHQFIRLGATPIRTSEEILEALGIEPREATPTLPRGDSPLEEKIYGLLSEPLLRDELIRQLEIPISEANIALTKMELKSLIKEFDGLLRRL